MSFPLFLPPVTPAFVYNECLIVDRARLLRRVRQVSGCRMLYSIKAFPFVPVLRLLAPWVEGYSVSSLYEARIAGELGSGALHITTPGYREDEIEEIARLCGHVTFNSLSQFRRLQPRLGMIARAGLRLNPQLSFLDDIRYDPCRPYSKLGVVLEEVMRAWQDDVHFRRTLTGLHVHSVFGVRGFAPLQKTVELLERKLAPVLSGVEWLNLGGGYVFEDENELEELAEIARMLSERHQLEVYFEPGNAVVGEAGYLVASVIDSFQSDGRSVAVLDTSVNHLPEVFEYQRRPQLAEPTPLYGEDVLLVGGTCLAGDVFGEYRFDRPLAPGDRVAFRNVGAYSLVKANRFNGHNLPLIYAWDGGDRLIPAKTYGYDDYRRQWAADEPNQGGL